MYNGERLDEGELHGQVDALVLAAPDAGGERRAVARGDRRARVVELEAADEGSDERLVLEEREAHADADARALGERDEAAPAARPRVRWGHATLAGRAVARLGGVAAPDEPARGAEGVRVAEDVRVAVDADRRDVDHLALLDWDRLDPRTVCAADGVPERDDVVLFGDLFVARRRGEHAHGLFADGIEVGQAVGRGKVVKGRLALDAQDFVAELGLDIRVLRKRPGGESKGGRGRLVARNTMRETLGWRGSSSKEMATRTQM